MAAGIDGIETRRQRGSFLAKARGRDGPEVGSKKLLQARESEYKSDRKGMVLEAIIPFCVASEFRFCVASESQPGIF